MMNFSTNSIISFIKKPLVLIVLFGLLIRFALVPLAYDFDIYHWALTISNVNGGHNLYEIDGYYYTPVWGYLLGAMSSVSEFFFNGLLGMRVTEILPIENLEWPYHIATITTITFNLIVKIPLIICDVVVGYLIYWLIKDRTADTKKATIGFGLWFLCPIVIYMSSIQAQFDSFSALFLLLSIILLYKDKCFLGGMIFSLAVLLKFFPGFCIIIILAYVFVKYKENGLAKRKLLETILGIALMSIILLLPVILNGQFGSMMSFITGRTDGGIVNILTMAAAFFAIFMMFFLGRKMFQASKEDADRKLFAYIFITATTATLMSATPQYIIVALPFMILYIVTVEKCYMKCWTIISVSAVATALVHTNFSMFCSLAVYSGLVSPEWVIGCMQFLESGMGFNLIAILAFVNILIVIGVFMVLLFFFADDIKKINPKLGNFFLKLKHGRDYNET